MSQLKKEYKVKLKTFRYIGILILLATAAYVISSYDASDPDVQSRVLSYGVLAAFLGVFMLYFGNKSRKIEIYDDKIEYHTSKLQFSSTYEELSLISVFKQEGKSSEILMLSKKDGSNMTISNAFFDKDMLISAFKDLVQISEKHDIEIEDELNWLEK